MRLNVYEAPSPCTELHTPHRRAHRRTGSCGLSAVNEDRSCSDKKLILAMGAGALTKEAAELHVPTPVPTPSAVDIIVKGGDDEVDEGKASRKEDDATPVEAHESINTPGPGPGRPPPGSAPAADSAEANAPPPPELSCEQYIALFAHSTQTFEELVCKWDLRFFLGLLLSYVPTRTEVYCSPTFLPWLAQADSGPQEQVIEAALGFVTTNVDVDRLKELMAMDRGARRKALTSMNTEAFTVLGLGAKRFCKPLNNSVWEGLKEEVEKRNRDSQMSKAYG